MKLKSTLLLLLALLLPAVSRAEWGWRTYEVSTATNPVVWQTNQCPENTIYTNLHTCVRFHNETKVVEWNNEKGCSTCAGIRANGWAIYHRPTEKCSEPYQAATEKWIATNIVQKISFQIMFEGDATCHYTEKLLSSTTNHFKLTTSWEKAP